MDSYVCVAWGRVPVQLLISFNKIYRHLLNEIEHTDYQYKHTRKRKGPIRSMSSCCSHFVGESICAPSIGSIHKNPNKTIFFIHTWDSNDAKPARLSDLTAEIRIALVFFKRNKIIIMSQMIIVRCSFSLAWFVLNSAGHRKPDEHHEIEEHEERMC